MSKVELQEGIKYITNQLATGRGWGRESQERWIIPLELWVEKYCWTERLLGAEKGRGEKGVQRADPGQNSYPRPQQAGGRPWQVQIYWFASGSVSWASKERIKASRAAVQTFPSVDGNIENAPN